MEAALRIAAIWLGLSVISAVIARRLRITIALIEVCVGVGAAYVAFRFFTLDALGADQEWLKFMASAGAILLTFMAGAELDPISLRSKIKEVSLVGMLGFFAPFLGCAAVAHYLLDWSPRASLLAGIALSATSTAVVYSMMIESGLNKTSFGKGIIGSCFVNDLAAVLALGILLAPLSYRTAIFAGACVAGFFLLPTVTAWLTRHYAHRTAAIRTKWILFTLFGLGAMALWAGSEAVLPAYIAGMVLAGSAAKDAQFVRRLRTLTLGFLTPFYFIRAGSLVSLNAVVAAPVVLAALLTAKIVTKVLGIYPAISVFRQDNKERWFYALLMSTGLTFGTIAAIYGLANGIINQQQYSCVVAAVIASAVVPTIIATAVCLPRHLTPSVDQPAAAPAAPQ